MDREGKKEREGRTGINGRNEGKEGEEGTKKVMGWNRTHVYIIIIHIRLLTLLLPLHQ